MCNALFVSALTLQIDGVQSDPPNRPRSIFGRVRQQTAGSIRGARSDGETISGATGAVSAPSSPDSQSVRRSSIMSRVGTGKSSTGLFSRNRKPAPRVTSSILELPPGSTANGSLSKSSSSSRRSTRLFAFGNAPSSPPQQPAVAARPVISTPLEAGPPMAGSEATAVTPDPTPKSSMVPPPSLAEEPEPQDAVSQIGTPDLKGWLYKKGDGFTAWKQRWVLLKGNHVYWLKSPQVRMASSHEQC